jgi:mannobiose 2-epimerase
MGQRLKEFLRMKESLWKRCWSLFPYHAHSMNKLPALSQVHYEAPYLSKDTLERILTVNILPFWENNVTDTKYGGYRLYHDLRGRWKGMSNKRLVAQARTLWFFAALENSRYKGEKYRTAAWHGFQYLREQMADKEYGGFYWELNPVRHRPTMEGKHAYGHAFLLLAFSEFALACDDILAKSSADELFELFEEKFLDSHYGGYREFFSQNWKEPSNDGKNYLTGPPTAKSQNTHLHIMRAMIAYYKLTKSPLTRKRIFELISILGDHIIRKSAGTCTDLYHRDWTPYRGDQYDRVSYGHCIENALALIEACETTEKALDSILGICQDIFSHVLRYGYDYEYGGFFFSGPLCGPADRREKIWWVQAEGLQGVLQMYHVSNDELYAKCYYQTLHWILTHQIDWEHGDWHAEILSKGRPWGDKAGPWKSPYHNGRAILNSIKLLSPGGAF